MMNRYISALSAFIFLLTACSDTLQGKGVAEPEVAHFHQLLQSKDFETIYDNAAPEFRSAVPKKKVLALFAAIDRKLGPVMKSKQINWGVNTQNLVTTVTLVYASKFQEGDATETFTFYVSNGKPALAGYNIASIDMLIK